MAKKLCKLYIPRLMALLLCVTVLFTCVPAVSAAEGGGCGDGLSWSYADGMLTITGSGAMTDYPSSASVPWYAYRKEITGLSLPAGLTHIGALAFYDCDQLMVLDVPDSVRSIGEYAFAGCRQMQLLDLGSSLQVIGDGAFYSCRAIAALRLPSGLKSIGREAFYDCTGFSALTVPFSVTSIGAAAFAYCTSLIQVDIQCQLTNLPEWIFFGCKQLTSVTLPASVISADSTAFQQCGNLRSVNRGGETLDKTSLQQTPEPETPQSGGSGNASATGTEYPDGSFQIQTNTVVENDNSTVTSSMDYTGGQENPSVSSDITVTVENDKGWEEIRTPVQEALEDFGSQSDNLEVGSSDLTIYVKDTDTIDQTFVDSLAEENVNITFVSEDGSRWQVDSNNIAADGSTKSYDMRYELQPASEKICKKVGTSACYLLIFRESGQINAEVLISLGKSTALQEATLLQDGEAIARIQTTVVDADGYAHFYLGSVDAKTEYYIAINMAPLPGEEDNDAIVPQPLASAYGNAVNIQPIQYEITGRKSSWNMGLGQVMGILAAVMIGAVALVGLIMYLWNKERLKNGYVPQWDDDEE